MAFPNAGHRRGWFNAFRGDHQRFRLEHRQSIVIARSRLPVRPFPGERGFTGVPVAGESRYIRNEVMLRIGPNVSEQTIDAVARRLGLSSVGSQNFGVAGGTVVNFRIADGRPIDDVVRALETENIGIAQPDYVYTLQQDKRSAARTPTSGQYVVSKLRLAEVHRVATGSNVVVAVIDSGIDAKHPDLEGAVVDRFDAGGRQGEPHAHGTGMAGAIAARRRLTGIAPGAQILAVHAFGPDAKEAPQATTRHILAGIDWAIKKGARIINMSFAGPYDPMLQMAIKQAHDKGVVMIAAAGNLGPKSPPLYPAADSHVIAVTATDQGDRLFAQANQGPHVAVSAPGVDILEPAPNSGYQLTTGTSVAAAHVSGVVALLLDRDPSLDPTAVHEILTATAKNVGAAGRDDQFGWGLVDPSKALQELEAKLAQEREAPAVAAPVKPAAAKPSTVSAR
jgi:subtilisin family serine protease